MSDDDGRLKITGKGFSDGELSAQERAELREFMYRMGREFLTAEAFLKETGLEWISKMAQGVPAFLKVLLYVSAIGAAVTAAKAMGFL